VRAFEPSVGIGRLVRAMGPPRCLVTDARYKETRWTAVELSEVSAKMFAAMRPDVELYAMSLEQWMSEHAARYQGTLASSSPTRRMASAASSRCRTSTPTTRRRSLLRVFHAPLPRPAGPARPRRIRHPLPDS
jgi:hypothetical protein